jgi:hypothetical protein
MSESLERDLYDLGDAWRSAASASLRQRTADISAQAAGTLVTTVPLAPLGDWRRSALRVGAALVGATAVVVLLIPGARVALARQADWLLQVLQIAPSTDLVTSGLQSREEVNASVQQERRLLESGRSWHVSTVYGGYGGSVPKGASAVPQRIDRPDVLSSLAPIPLLAPNGIHRGQGVSFHYAWLAPDGVVLAFFGFGDAEVFLLQAPIRSGQRIAYSRVVSGAGGTTIGVTPAIETLTVNGQRLTWDADTTGIMPNSSALRWEANGVSYSLYGQALTREEAVALFSGLRPLS